MKSSVHVGDRVKFVDVFPLAPDSVHDMLGEIGTARVVELVQVEIPQKSGPPKFRSWNVWLVVFDDRQIWIKEKGLEVVG